ncbi:unnamed protein product [Cylindrotheca closterium]|uniref:Uncharacterized protein n=1 Tax=Cylindrotheca closterium TaxID=2856 RepID=A0AAD2CGE7_9STRA|nr:unnamed protein product [Cylindrotheca closterium]
MSREVQSASPYPWGDDQKHVSHPPSIKLLQGERYVGSGFAALEHQLGDNDNSEMDENAKLILNNLLQEHNVNLLDSSNDDKRSETEKQNAHGVYTGIIRPPKRSKLPSEVSAPKDILELARDGKVSVFSSLLDTVESSSIQPVPTKTLIRKCCLTIPPGDSPGSIDAKDYILGALHFLSSQFESSSEERYPSLPLIYPVQLTGDVEKRNYEKVGEWKLDEIQDKVLLLEQVFTSSPNSWKWLRRESFAPRLEKEEETAFFVKGAIPARAKKIKTEATTGRKRKTTASAAASPVASSSKSMPATESQSKEADEQERSTVE